MQAVNKFNETLSMFLGEVETLLEKMEDPAAKEVLPDILFAHSKLDGLLFTPGADKKAPLKMFVEHMLPFSSKIQQKDSSFFLEDLAQQPWLKCSPKLGTLFAQTCQANQDQIWEYLTYLSFLAEGVSALPEDQLEMVDQLLEKLEKNPQEAIQDMMAMMQESADTMGAGPPMTTDGKNPMDDIFASLSGGKALDLESVFKG